MSLSSLEAAVQAKERELAQLKLQLQQRQHAPKPTTPLPPPTSNGNFVCFGSIIFLPNPSTFRPTQTKWISGQQSLNVPHIMLVVDYCTGELKTAGGRSNAGESALDCMNREFIEETGYDSPVCRFRNADLRYQQPLGRVCAFSYVKYATLEVPTCVCRRRHQCSILLLHLQQPSLAPDSNHRTAHTSPPPRCL